MTNTSDTYDPVLDYFGDCGDTLAWAMHPFLARLSRRRHRLTRGWRVLSARETTIAALEYALANERLWCAEVRDELADLRAQHERLRATLEETFADEQSEWWDTYEHSG